MLLGILHRLRMTYRGDDVANLVTKHLDTFGGLKFSGANGCLKIGSREHQDYIPRWSQEVVHSITFCARL